MLTITVRRAENHDLESLCRLYVAFHEFHVAGVPDRLRSIGDPATFDCTALVATLTTLLENTAAALFVAIAENKVVGLAEVYARDDEATEGRPGWRFGYLQSLMVDQDWRQHGIGQRLLQAAESWSVTQGGTELRLETWEFPAGPRGFYERCGYTTLRRTFVRPLSQR